MELLAQLGSAGAASVGGGIGAIATWAGESRERIVASLQYKQFKTVECSMQLRTGDARGVCVARTSLRAARGP